MRILFFGSSDFAIPTFASILNDGHQMLTAVTQPDRPRGRGKRPTPTPVKAFAVEKGIPVITPEDVNVPDVADHLISLNADLGYVASFGQKIGPVLLEAFPAGMVNLHASLLPAWRGAAPIQWSVINGNRETGVTVFRLVEKMDAGSVLVQRRTAINDDETAEELHDRLARIGCDAVRATLEILQDDPTSPGTPQDPEKVSRARKLRKADGCVAFDQPVAKVSKRICGLWSWPGAACRFVSADGSRDEQVILARAIPYEGKPRPAASPDDLGRITDVMSVQCVDGELALLQVKPAGGKLMDWRDFVNGRHVRAGDRFVPLTQTGTESSRQS